MLVIVVVIVFVLSAVDVRTESLHVELGDVDSVDELSDARPLDSLLMEIHRLYFSLKIDGEPIYLQSSVMFR